MNLISRSNWTDAVTLITAALINAEYNLPYNVLNGGSTDYNVLHKYSGALAAMTVEQLNAGDIAHFRQSGANKNKVNANGQWVNLLTTGTAPLKTPSITLVNNLNVDLLDGIQSSQFLRNTVAGNVLSILTLLASASGENLKFDLNANTLTVKRSSDDFVICTISAINTAPVIAFPTGVSLRVVDAPTVTADVIRKTEKDANKVLLINYKTKITLTGAFHFAHWICPIGSKYTLDEFHGVTETAPGSNQVLTLFKNGVSQAGQTITFQAGDVFRVRSRTGIALSVAEGDRLSIRCSASAGTPPDATGCSITYKFTH